MTHRTVVGLRYAAMSLPPPHAGKGRPRGAKAAGVRFERELAKALPVARHGQWFQFIDANGHGWCQTDLLLEFPECMVVLEAKYTWTEEGHGQVDRLYGPVVARAFGKPTFGLVVCRALRDSMPEVLIQAHLGEAILWAEKRKRVALHWLGGQSFLKLALAPHFGDVISPHAPLFVPHARSA